MVGIAVISLSVNSFLLLDTCMLYVKVFGSNSNSYPSISSVSSKALDCDGLVTVILYSLVVPSSAVTVAYTVVISSLVDIDCVNVCTFSVVSIPTLASVLAVLISTFADVLFDGIYAL